MRSVSGRGLVALAFVVCVPLIAPSAAQAAGACTGTTPIFTLDSDGDGLPDACDPCPLGNQSLATPSRDPYCYLATAAIPSDYQAQEGQTPGPWWSEGTCVPAMAFPVVDVPNGSQVTRGLVIVGTAPADASGVLAAARAGQTWPASVSAACLVSFDYARSEQPITPFGLRAPVLATLYAQWGGLADDRYFPKDGLGLITGWPIDSVTVRSFFRSVGSTALERLPFSRAVLYGRDLEASSAPSCSTTLVAATASPSYDPTQAQPDETLVTTCSTASGSNPAPEPTDWRVVPTALDAALLSQRNLLNRLFAGTGLAGTAILQAIEGVPLGLHADDRSAVASVQLLATGAMAQPPQGGRGWTIVPEAISTLRQHLEYAPKTGDYSVTPYLATSDAEYSLAAQSPASALVAQSFQVDAEIQQPIVDAAQRTVETLWPDWPAPAATSEHSVIYGDRWTTNGGPRDCWYSTVDDTDVTGLRPNQQLSYPVSAPENNTLAVSFCPSSLEAWRDQPTTPRSQIAANQVCAPAIQFQASLTSSLLGSAFNCAESYVEDSVSNAVGCCLNSICSLIPFDDCDDDDTKCCSSAFDSLFSNIAPSELMCVANYYFTSLAEFTPDQEWEPIGTNIPMVALIRTNGDGPSIDSTISNEDMFVAGRHQGMDWNWKAETAAAIDPAYRAIALRDGLFLGIEDELEFQVAMGQWKGGWNDMTGRPAWNLHGANSLEDYVGMLTGDRGISPLGEIWPSDDPFGRLYGLGGESWPVPTPTLPAYWRQHYGRGMFTPIDTATLSSSAQSHLMAIDHDWPLVTTDPLDKGVTPLGLDDWELVPHRISFLGDAILDCGHSPYRVEIHPPHVITMDFAHLTYGGVSNGVVVGAFGWVNVRSSQTLEFDLWPPPRPSASARLVAMGADVQLPEGSVAGAFGPSSWGWAFDRNLAYSAATPTMSCRPFPTALPNHIHCVYSDPSNASRPGQFMEPQPTVAGDLTSPYANPRMTPSYATSRFDLRIFLGWK
jgi:hypothetical protein